MRKIFLLFAILLAALIAKADEGMWLAKELDSDIVTHMQELGFSVPINRLYCEEEPSLKDAAVIFGDGCSGVVVSDLGLIFTNHHCGFGAIQKLSSVENDYISNGFVAKSRSEELIVDGLTISFLRSMSDVTDQVLPYLPQSLSEKQRELTIDSLSNVLIKEYENDPFTSAEVIPFYSRNRYWMVLYDIFRDVRLVAAPPESVGKFGGDSDNWSWPRHTGDFSVFRLYADKNNKPSHYNETNQPYKPKYVVPVSLSGVRSGDYVMTLGYPGSTDRYISSLGIEQRVEAENLSRIEVRAEKQAVWWDAMTRSDTVRIKYASKYAVSSNYWKNSIGMNEAISNLALIERKKYFEVGLDDWINSSRERVEKYGTLLTSLEEGYSSAAELAKYTGYWLEIFHNGIELINFANTILMFDSQGSEEDKQRFIQDRLIDAYTNYDSELDKKLLSRLMRLYAERVPEEFHPDIYQKIGEKFEGDYELYAEWLFANTQFGSFEKMLDLIQSADSEQLIEDPAMVLALSVTDMGYELSERLIPHYEKILRGEREYMAALMEMNPEKLFYPDANFTQRLSYGVVEGYSPADAVWYDYYTTAAGMLHKQKPGDPEFDLQQYIIDNISTGDFGRYADEDGFLRVNFLSTNDITGGNSGSPVLNGNGELVGLAFDGNWESLSGDIIFEPATQRMISVDILYVLYMLDRVLDAQHIVNELNISLSPKP